MMAPNSKTNSEILILQTLLKYTFTIVPIAAGTDKFLNILTSWERYISPGLSNLQPLELTTFIKIIGGIEIIAGILVYFKTRFGAYVVAAWLTLIAITLVLSGDHLDIAVRDLVMAVGAFTLARLSAFLNK